MTAIPPALSYVEGGLIPRGANAVGLLGTIAVSLHRYARFTDSEPGDVVAYQLSREITSVSWRHNRIGGCGSATIVLSDENLESSRYKPLIKPLASLVDEGDLYGGYLRIWAKLFPGKPTSFGDTSLSEVYIGRISKMTWSRSSSDLTIQTEGLMSAFDETFLETNWTNISIRDILDAVIDPLVKGNTASGLDGPLLGKDIYVPNSLIDLILPEVTATGEKASSVLERVLSLIQGRYVYGVDRLGRFYLQPQDEVFSDGTASLPVDGYFLSQEAIKFSRTFDHQELRTIIKVVGSEDPDNPGIRVEGKAQNQRMTNLLGPREFIQKEQDINDPSLAGKLAQALGRDNAMSLVTAQLSVDELIHPQKSFRHVTFPSAAGIYINETGEVHENVGATPASALRLNGKISELFDLPFSPEYNLQTNWLMHFSFTFESAPQLAGNNFIFGRQNENISIDGKHGWGYWTWNGTSGQLVWNWTDVVGLTNRVLGPPGLVIPVGGPFPITIHLTIERNIGGSFNVWVNGVRIHSFGYTGQAVTGGSYDSTWRGFKSRLPAHGGVEGTINNFFFYDTTELHKKYGNAITATAFLLSTSGQRRLWTNYRMNGTGTVGGPGLQWWSEFAEDQTVVDPDKWPIVKSGFDGSVLYGTMVRSSSVGGNPPASEHFRGPKKYLDGSRWGGPLVLNYDSVVYSVQPELSRVVKTFELGGRAEKIDNILASVNEQVRRLQEEDRRV